MELDIGSIATYVGIIVAGGGAIFALGRLFEKVKQVERRVDKLENSKDDKKANSLSILEEEYARGKISVEEYDERRKKLQE